MDDVIRLSDHRPGVNCWVVTEIDGDFVTMVAEGDPPQPRMRFHASGSFLDEIEVGSIVT